MALMCCSPYWENRFDLLCVAIGVLEFYDDLSCLQICFRIFCSLNFVGYHLRSSTSSTAKEYRFQFPHQIHILNFITVKHYCNLYDSYQMHYEEQIQQNLFGRDEKKLLPSWSLYLAIISSLIEIVRRVIFFAVSFYNL